MSNGQGHKNSWLIGSSFGFLVMLTRQGLVNHTLNLYNSSIFQYIKSHNNQTTHPNFHISITYIKHSFLVRESAIPMNSGRWTMGHLQSSQAFAKENQGNERDSTRPLGFKQNIYRELEIFGVGVKSFFFNKKRYSFSTWRIIPLSK